MWLKWAQGLVLHFPGDPYLPLSPSPSPLPGRQETGSNSPALFHVLSYVTAMGFEFQKLRPSLLTPEKPFPPTGRVWLIPRGTGSREE